MDASKRPIADYADIGRWMIWLVAGHLCLWILLPLLFEGSIRLDVSEGAIDGREWQLAYLRHPPFTTWAVEVTRWAGPLRYAALYLLGQSLAISGLLLLALTSRNMAGDPQRGKMVGFLTIALGLISPMLTYIPIQVSHNIGLMVFSGFIVYTAFHAFERGQIADWLLLGVSLGFSLWAKYAILLLAGPLGIAFLVVPAWRKQLWQPGPWLSLLLAAIIISPHAIFVMQSGATTISFATRTISTGWLTNLAYAGGFLLNAALFAVPMLIVVLLLQTDRSAFFVRMLASFRPARSSRQDVFRHVVTFGPVLATALASLFFGVKPRLLWLTPMVPSFAMWLAFYAVPTEGSLYFRRGTKAIAALAATLVLSYAGIRLASPYYNKKTLYPDFDGLALAQLANSYWATNQTQPLRYIVSFGQQKGRQAAGSVAFDLPDPEGRKIHIMEDASLVASPWIDLTDLKKHGALVISPVPITDPMNVQGLPITKITALPRPMVRGATRAEPGIWFGVVEPIP